ncbi:hypothetical protein HV276_09565 [Escherichia marmotae]|uniref:Uncharacterized protein n=1 Tax=Escherichia marmotae TaxID=1499973 RepID=A0A7L6LA71_9ESCH|nr:hypothetical protein [Escherichia marmotae]EIG7796899.1 hypothetical protein [Escherichia coli]QLX29941.1 hypothetical protein HV276_09565 [Escherichia marmotae]
MHSISFFSFRILTHKGSRTSKKLNDLGLSNKKTAYELLVDYFNLYKNSPIEFGVSKTKISLEQNEKLTFDDNKKTIHGYIKVGKYGESSEIKDITLEKIHYRTTVHDVTLKERYILIYLPDELEEGIIVFHSSDNVSARSILSDAIVEYFKKQFNLEARINPLCHKEIPKYILDSELKQIRAQGYNALDDITDSFGCNKTNIKTDLLIKVNEGMMGSFRDLRSKKLGNIIEIIEDKCDAIKVSLQIGNRTVVYNYNTILKKGISAELDDNDLKINPATGIPDLEALHDSIKDIANDILSELHNGNEGVKI